jgi:hypothetical protein
VYNEAVNGWGTFERMVRIVSTSVGVYCTVESQLEGLRGVKLSSFKLDKYSFNVAASSLHKSFSAFDFAYLR